MNRAVVTLFVLSLFGSDGARPRAATAQSNIPAVSLRQTAAALARSGIAHRDPRSVLAAAQLLIVAERPSPGLERVTPQRASVTAAGLLREAVRIAVEQHDVVTANAAMELAGNARAGLGDAALASELRAAASLGATRGAVGGPVWADGELAPGTEVEYRITFEGDYQPSRLVVTAGDGAADLDCHLYDGSQLVGSDAGHARECGLAWSQRFTGVLTLRVHNSGAATYYVLVSN
ncbi:MAG: hypothetical protein DMD28_11900 [Gemmatimonadetes bacterium]|nr:MAG: hypothetical protein DMD28_11900 [Gemmatimonadota bacterium]